MTKLNDSKQTLAHLGIAALNEMQEAAVSNIIHHKNVLLLSPTGSGKP